MNPTLQELEYAAQLLFAPHSLVTVEQRQAAEQVFLSFKTQNSPYEFCREIFQQSRNDYVLYQAATTVKEALVKEWLLLNKTDIEFWQNFLLAFICERKNLQKYVIEKAVQCLAVIIKRGTLDHSSGSSSLQHFMGNIHQLFSSSEPKMKLLGCSMMKALLYEYSTVGRASDIRLSFEFHCKCKAHFESCCLQQFFISTMQALQSFVSMSSQSLPKDHVEVLTSLLSITESILSWEFTPKNPLRAFHSRGNETASLILFKPGKSWRDTLLNGNCLEVFFNLHSCVKNNEQLLHHYFLCLTQFASLTDSIFPDNSSTARYLGRLLHGVLQLVQQYSAQLSGVVACGFANAVNRIMTVFPVSLLFSLPPELVQAYLHSISQLTQSFLQTAMRNQELHNDDTSHMEAFDQILVAWVSLVSSSSSFPKGFLSGPCLQILHLYVKTHIAAPEGTRNSQEEQDLEEIVELRDTDLEEFDDQLSSIAQLARHVLVDAVPLLDQLLNQRIKALLEHLRVIKEKGPLAVDSIKTENLYEDLHWLLLIAGYVLSDDVSGEKSLIPDQVMMYSIAESEKVHLESTVKYLMSLGAADLGSAKIDSVTKLITSVLRVADVEKQALSAGLGPTMSPELGGNIVWILTKCCDVYLMPSESEYGQVSVPLVTAFGKDTESARWLVSFVLDKVIWNFRGWLSEASVLENTAQLLVTLMANKSSAHAALSCEVLAQLAKDFAENTSYVKELPSLVQRELSRALVTAGSAFEQDQSRKQYLSQILNPIKTRFDAIVQAPSFRKGAQHEAIKDEVERLLECFRGVAMASSVRTVDLLFTFLVPVLNDCAPLLDVYRNCPETVEIILSLLFDVVEYQLAYLSKNDARKLYEICVRLMEVYSKCSLGKRSGTILAEEETFLDLLIFMKILTSILTKTYFDLTSDDNGQNSSGQESADVVLYGLNILLPFITPELLKFPELNDHYFKLITFVCEEHTEKICLIPEHLFANLIASLEQGLKECGTDIAKSTLEALSGMAYDLFRKRQGEAASNRLSNALKSLLKVLFNFIMFEKFEVLDLLVPAADALWSLICCHQTEYAALVQTLLASQTDSLVHQRLVDSFNKLTPADISITIDKHTKDQFRKNLDTFLADVKGLLCVR